MKLYSLQTQVVNVNADARSGRVGTFHVELPTGESVHQFCAFTNLTGFGHQQRLWKLWSRSEQGISGNKKMVCFVSCCQI